MEYLAKYVVYIGLITVCIGISLYFFSDYLGWVGKTPLDFSYKNDNVNIYFPFGTMLIISIALTFIFNLFNK